MKIKKIILKNWQTHENLKLNFSDGLNIITGLSDTGKSSIRRAIEFICFPTNISEVDFRKEGTDLTSVIIGLDNGFEIEKIRSNTLNRYILRKESCEDKIFDSIGKTIPEEIKQVLGVDLIEIDKDSINLNIANQLTLPFLLDKPASFRAKLFNKLTGNEKLDLVFQACNKEGLSINKEIKILEEQIIKQKEDVKIVEQSYKELYDKVQKVKDLYLQIEEKIIIYDELKKLASKLKTNKEVDDFIQFKLNKIIIISDNVLNKLKKDADKLTSMLTLRTKLTYVNQTLQEIKVKEKNIPEINFNEIKQKVKMFDNLKQLFYKLEHNKEEQEKIDFLNSKIKIPQVDFETLKEDNLMLNELSKLKNKLIENKENDKKITLQLQNIKDSSVKFAKQLKEVWDKLDFCEKCKPIAERVIFGRK